MSLLDFIFLNLVLCLSSSPVSAYVFDDDDDVVISVIDEPCSASPCHNGATCVNIGFRDFLCTCAVGYYGGMCEHALPCTGNPCQNGGMCQIINRSSYACACPDGYWGKQCEHAHHCISAPCRNGGFCHNNDTTGYHCDCRSGYYGDQCQLTMPCMKTPCTNGGTCVAIGRDDFRCDCTLGQTGDLCESEVDCGRAKPWLQGQHAHMTDLEDRRPSTYGATKPCQCNYGYYSLLWSRDCRMRCQGDGAWAMVSGCHPVYCGSYNVDHGQPYNVTSGNVTFRSRVKYVCDAGYVMAGDDTLECGVNLGIYRARYSRDPPLSKGRREKVGKSWPYCLPREECDAPPSIEHGRLIHYNSTLEYGQAEYACAPEVRMVGDGKATCLVTGEYRLYDNGNGKRYHVKKLEWIFLPRCEARMCPLPVGKTGSQASVIVKVTKCTTRSFARFPDERCEEPNFYHVSKNETGRGLNVAFYGEELCVARMYEIVKTYPAVQYSSTRTECKGFCIRGHNGYHRVVTKDTIRQNSRNMTLERVTYRYKTLRAG